LPLNPHEKPHYAHHADKFHLLGVILVALIVILLDQATKYAVIKNVAWEPGNPTYHFNSPNPPIPVIDNFFYIVHIANEGAAWGMLSGRTYFLTSIAIFVLLGMWLFRVHLGIENKLVQVAMGLFAGGVVGNLIDRVCYGHVVDFLDVHLNFINYRWPAFNIADCGISIGVTLYIIVSFILDYKERKAKNAAPPPSTDIKLGK